MRHAQLQHARLNMCETIGSILGLQPLQTEYFRGDSIDPIISPQETREHSGVLDMADEAKGTLLIIMGWVLPDYSKLLY